LSVVSIQLGAALATLLFAELGPAGTSFLSTVFTALLLALAAPVRIDRRVRDHIGLILAFGLVNSAMFLPFLLALRYLPLGIVSTVAFLGPLGLAVATAHRVAHFLWIGVALVGIVLLAPAIGTDLSPLGLGLAALAGLAWAGFVIVSKQAGRVFPGRDGLTLGVIASGVMLAPFALAEGDLGHTGPTVLGGVLAVALLGSVIPYILEYRALQRVSARTYGILMTLEPAIGALIGALFLGQALAPRAWAAIFCVTLASLGIVLADRADGDSVRRLG
jgi:inner membrane transporter RhtA